MAFEGQQVPGGDEQLGAFFGGASSLSSNCKTLYGQLGTNQGFGTIGIQNEGLLERCGYDCFNNGAPQTTGLYYIIGPAASSLVVACTTDIQNACYGTAYSAAFAYEGYWGDGKWYLMADPGPITLTASLGTTQGTYAAGSDNTGAAGKVYQWPSGGGANCKANTTAQHAPPFAGGEAANHGALPSGAVFVDEHHHRLRRWLRLRLRNGAVKARPLSPSSRTRGP